MISQPASIIRRLVLLVVVATGCVACAGGQTTRSEPRPPSGAQSTRNDTAVANSAHSSVGRRAAEVALEQVGVPYRFGGSSPSGFDCSGLVHYSYASAGMSIPRTTARLYTELDPVESRQFRTGDLLFFSISGKMSHVGLYLGQGRFVHAPSTGRVVSVESLESDYYRKALIRGGRPR